MCSPILFIIFLFFFLTLTYLISQSTLARAQKMGPLNGNMIMSQQMTSTPLSSRTTRSVLRVHNVNSVPTVKKSTPFPLQSTISMSKSTTVTTNQTINRQVIFFSSSRINGNFCSRVSLITKLKNNICITSVEKFKKLMKLIFQLEKHRNKIILSSDLFFFRFFSEFQKI